MSFFLTLEGPEGSGKSTHARGLADHLEERGHRVLCTHEPGGTPIGETLRAILLDPEHDELTDRSELLLYLADRAQHVQQTIRPALRRGAVVISDRYVDSTLVYQGVVRGLGEERVRRLNRWVTGGLRPDLTIIIDDGEERGLEAARAQSRQDWNVERGDRIESESEGFHRSVMEAYRSLAEQHPDRCVLVPRGETVQELQDELRHLVTERLGAHER